MKLSIPTLVSLAILLGVWGAQPNAASAPGPEPAPPGPLHGVLVFTSESEIAPGGISNFGGLYLAPLPGVGEKDRIKLSGLLKNRWGQTITPELTQLIQAEIEGYLKRRTSRTDFKCICPQQNLSGGVLQLVLLTGQVEVRVRGILLVTNMSQVVSGGASNLAGLSLEYLPSIKQSDENKLRRRVRRFWEQPMTPELPKQLTAEIQDSLQRAFRPAEVSCSFPDQNTSTGVLQILVEMSQGPVSPTPEPPVKPEIVKAQPAEPKVSPPPASQVATPPKAPVISGDRDLLRGVVLVSDSMDVGKRFPNVVGLLATNISWIGPNHERELAAIVDAYLNQPITFELERNLRLEMESYFNWKFDLTNLVTYIDSGARRADGVMNVWVTFAPERVLEATNATPNFRGIRLISSESNLNDRGVTNQSEILVVEDLPFINQADKRAIEKILASYLGTNITYEMVDQIHTRIINYFQKENDFLTLDFYYPQQKVPEGVLQMVVRSGNIRQIRVVNPGRTHFSESLIRSRLSIATNQPVRRSQLEKDMDYLNRNANFREVSLQLVRPPEDFQRQVPEATAATDVEVIVQDEKWPINWPIRPFIGYENTGNVLVGEHRATAGLNYGNVFGLDHQLTYQFITDVEFKYFRNHVASYQMPLPWNHTFSVFGYYAEVKPNLARLGLADFGESDDNYQGSARYSIPLPVRWSLKHEVYAGFDYKHVETSLQFGTVELVNNFYEVGQFTLGYDASLRDSYGQTLLSMAGFYSPSGLFEGSDKKHFDAFRTGADPSYFYGLLNARRETILPWKLTWRIRAGGQVSSEKLLSSEQFGLGGASTVRGYAERVANGDEGFFISNELLSPAWEFDWLGWKPARRTRLQLLAFFDYGRTTVDTGALNNQHVSLDSTGAGFRFEIGKNLNVRVDYGYALRDISHDLPDAFDTRRHRIHAAAILSF